MITIEHLTKCYQDASGEITPVNDLSLTIKEGSFVSIIGRSGSGKTTFLKMAGGLLPPTSGAVLLNGTSLYTLSEKERSAFRRDHIGFIFQDFVLEEMFTVSQNIEIVLMLHHIPDKERPGLIKKALEEVSLFHKKDSLVSCLSGGEKQRTCIARAIVCEPEFLFADEPCGNLDSENGKTVMALLRHQARSGRTVVLITHNREDALSTDEIVTLQDGKIIHYENLRQASPDKA